MKNIQTKRSTNKSFKIIDLIELIECARNNRKQDLSYETNWTNDNHYFPIWFTYTHTHINTCTPISGGDLLRLWISRWFEINFNGKKKWTEKKQKCITFNLQSKFFEVLLSAFPFTHCLHKKIIQLKQKNLIYICINLLFEQNRKFHFSFNLFFFLRKFKIIILQLYCKYTKKQTHTQCISNRKKSIQNKNS